ncbi:MAG TPA: hypothetical protein VGP72_09105 [Planctomycetota bacterium]|jgi:hypothetical protein
MPAKLRFRTRNYKHELELKPGKPRWVGNYTDAIWEGLCKQIADHQFNGLVFYAGYHFFEYVLDYSGYPDAASQNAKTRDAVRASLRRGMAIAHKHGLKTFFQHYVGHFTPQLAQKYNIPTTGRFSNIEHPEVERYCRWCYREVFRQLPDLDGLYFNFESYKNADEHVMRTAFPEFNRMAHKPIMVLRLWDYTSFDGLRRMMDAYKGRIIVSHKIMDTNDAYYLPVADSRAVEWKKALGKRLEFMYCVGPCHNCGTNLCDQLWSDYEFVQKLLADAQAKGADSISFHTYRELFAADLPDPVVSASLPAGTEAGATPGVFSEYEKSMSRFNFLHVQAAVDYFNHVKRSPAEQAALLAQRCGVSPKAGPALHATILAASQPVLLTFQQFWLTSAYDGFLNRGRYSLIQDPFYYYPASELNHQASRPMWKDYVASWIAKKIDTRVAPDGQYQFILDYVNPARRKAPSNPLVIAKKLRQSARTAEASLRAYTRLAGKAAGGKLAPYVKQNLLLAEYVASEIEVGVALYSMYFAKTRAGMLAAAKAGLARLEYIAPLISDRSSAPVKTLLRMTMLNLDPNVEIKLCRELVRQLKQKSIPMNALVKYVASRREYNEIRRVIRPFRRHDHKSLGHARACLKRALAHAESALQDLQAPGLIKFSENVARWRDYLLYEQRGLSSPRISLPPPQDFRLSDSRLQTQVLRHDDCFRAGEDFLEDFLGFFRSIDYRREEKLFLRLARTKDALAVTLLEQCADAEARRALWAKWKGSGSDSFVMRVAVADPESKPQKPKSKMFIVWPEGSAVSMNAQANLPVRTAFKADEQHWETTVWLPFKLLGRKPPRKGEAWSLNVSASPYVNGNRAYTWAPQYDCDNPKLYGKVKF